MDGGVSRSMWTLSEVRFAVKRGERGSGERVEKVDFIDEAEEARECFDIAGGGTSSIRTCAEEMFASMVISCDERSELRRKGLGEGRSDE